VIISFIEELFQSCGCQAVGLSRGSRSLCRFETSSFSAGHLLYIFRGQCDLCERCGCEGRQARQARRQLVGRSAAAVKYCVRYRVQFDVVLMDEHCRHWTRFPLVVENLIGELRRDYRSSSWPPTCSRALGYLTAPGPPTYWPEISSAVVLSSTPRRVFSMGRTIEGYISGWCD
jgi:hypothetical protein